MNYRSRKLVVPLRIVRRVPSERVLAVPHPNQYQDRDDDPRGVRPYNDPDVVRSVGTPYLLAQDDGHVGEHDRRVDDTGIRIQSRPFQ